MVWKRLGNTEETVAGIFTLHILEVEGKNTFAGLALVGTHRVYAVTGDDRDEVKGQLIDGVCELLTRSLKALKEG